MASSAPFYEGPHIYLTLSDNDENEVLELVKSDETGLAIRVNGEWESVDPEADNDRIWDRVIVDLTERAVDVYDALKETGAPVKATQFKKFELREEAVL